MKAIKVSLSFFLACFLVQLSLFFIAPSFYLSSVDKSKVPIFIKLAFTKYFLLILALYLLWGWIAGLMQRALLRWTAPDASKVGGSILFHLSLGAAQFFLMFLAVAYFYPSIFGFLPKLPYWPLKQSYALFSGAVALALAAALAFYRPLNFKKTVGLVLTAVLPALLQWPFLTPSDLSLPQASASMPAKPHVLLLGFDALDAKSGNAAIEEAAKDLKVRVYANAFTPLPSTNPSWNSILTGLYPKHHRVRFIFESPFAPKDPRQYLPYRLKQTADYRTLFAADQPETSYFDHRHGFDGAVFPTVGWEAHLRSILLNHFIFPSVWLNNRWTERVFKTTINSPSLFNYDFARFFNYSFERLNDLPEGPRFMALHSCFLHSPIRLTRRELRSVPDYLDLSPKQFSFWDWPKVGDEPATTPKLWVNPYLVRRVVTQDFLKRLIGELKAKSYLDSSLIVLLSDHGERFAEGHEVYGGIHGIDLETRDQSNVVFTIFDPQLGGFEERQDVVSLIDLTPTLLARLGIPSEPVSYDGLALMDPRGQALSPPERPLWIENMGFIQASHTSSFPQILVQNLEESLQYKKNGGVVVGPGYYELIEKNKTIKDFSKELPTLQ